VAGNARGTMREPVFEIEEINDPVEVARCKAQDERGRRNSDWLQAHWADLLPQSRGKFVAVADQEAFIAGTAGRPGLGPPGSIQKIMVPWSVTCESVRGHVSMRIVGEWLICDGPVLSEPSGRPARCR